jgi:hypothetical protein
MMTALFGPILSLSENIRKCSRELENKIIDIIEKLSGTESRIHIIENGISKYEFDLNPSLVDQKLPRLDNKSDMDLVIDVFKEINNEGVKESLYIVPITRVGNGKEKEGTILVEMKSEDVKIKVMTTKECLIKHQNPMIRKLKLRNMKSLEQIFQENNPYKIFPNPMSISLSFLDQKKL